MLAADLSVGKGIRRWISHRKKKIRCQQKRKLRQAEIFFMGQHCTNRANRWLGRHNRRAVTARPKHEAGDETWMKNGPAGNPILCAKWREPREKLQSWAGPTLPKHKKEARSRGKHESRLGRKVSAAKLRSAAREREDLLARVRKSFGAITKPWCGDQRREKKSWRQTFSVGKIMRPK
jgi:hypothetical protein